MVSLNQVSSVSHRGRDRDVEDSSQQAGRTVSSLEAERRSAELRSIAPTPAPAQDDLEPRSRISSSNISESGRSSLLAANRKTSHLPTKPSPLNPRASDSSSISGGTDGNPDGKASSLESRSSSDIPRCQSSTNLPATARGRRRPGTISPAQQLWRQNSAPSLRQGQESRPSTPRLISELGVDYSRYPSTRDVSKAVSRDGSPSSAGREASQRPLLRTTTNNPFSDSQADLEKWGYPDDRLGVFNPYFGGEKGFILFEDEVEIDDKHHLPADDDDITYRPKLGDYMETRTIVSIIGGVFLILGLTCVFIILPILTYRTQLLVPNNSHDASVDKDGPEWAHVNDNVFPLMKNVRRGLIDPDTPASAKTRTSTFDDSTLQLVFSDEFNVPNRTFYPGDDPYWTAPDFWYGATQDLEWYDPDAATTKDGTLQFRLDRFPNHNLEYRSGMLNSWNQLCFKGGVFEVSVSLAGPAGVPGLWPGAWTMGNLGRPGYKASTEGVWPYTYDSCDVGITPNQSQSDGTSHLPGQKLNSCTCKGADHPSPGKGRGAPEIDILEASVDPNNRIGVVTQSYQVAPFDVWYRPNSNFMAIPNVNTTQMNTYCGGPFQQAVSATTMLNNAWYDGKAFQKYAFEYIPGTTNGKIAWFVGEEPTFILDGRAIGPNGNVKARQISQEPMSLILNLGISNSWSWVDIPDLKFPTIMHIDYVRLYQKKGQESVTCDPPGYPTTEYIANHPKAYQNPNLTEWDQTGYGWPKHKLNSDC